VDLLLSQVASVSHSTKGTQVLVVAGVLLPAQRSSVSWFRTGGEERRITAEQAQETALGSS
jgi:hypothetical protein